MKNLVQKASNVSVGFVQDTSVTYRISPVSRNKILIRLDNLGDLIDQNNKQISLAQKFLNTTVTYIDLKQLADELFESENGYRATSIDIQEMSLQGVYTLEQTRQKMWRTRDNNSTELRELAQDNKEGFRGVALENQRLRTFQVTYYFDPKAATLKGKQSSKEDSAIPLGYTKNDSDYQIVQKSSGIQQTGSGEQNNQDESQEDSF